MICEDVIFYFVKVLMNAYPTFHWRLGSECVGCASVPCCRWVGRAIGMSRLPLRLSALTCNPLR